MDTTFLAAVRVIGYLVFIFLILFDLPVAKDKWHKLTLLALTLWLGTLFGLAILLLWGYTDAYEAMRDYAVTPALILVVITHLLWLNRRNK